MFILQIKTPGRTWATALRLTSRAIVAPDARNAADLGRGLLESYGLRYSELSYHIEDLARGHVLTTEMGVQFRVIEVEYWINTNLQAAGWFVWARMENEGDQAAPVHGPFALASEAQAWADKWNAVSV